MTVTHVLGLRTPAAGGGTSGNFLLASFAEPSATMPTEVRRPHFTSIRGRLMWTSLGSR